MKLSDFTQKLDGEKSQTTQSSDSVLVAKDLVREQLYRQIPSERLAQLAGLGRTRAKNELSALVQQVIASGNFDLEPGQQERIVDEIVAMIVGLGPLEPLLNDDTVTEVMVVGHDKVFFERDGCLSAAQECFDTEEQLRLVIDRIVSPLGRRVDEQQPIVNARLPQGHRVNVVIPPVSLVGSVLTIRKFKAVSFSLWDMVELDSLSGPIAQLLAWAVKSRKNIAVCGGTGGGKTTLLNALSQEIPHDERIVTIEDAAELRFDTHPHVVRMEARMANAEGNGEVSIRDLVTNALRMRPDRIIVGECRSSEALDMLQAMNTGHDGSLTTLHAGSPEEAVARLVMMVRYGMDLPTQVIEDQVVSAIDLIVQQDRIPGGHRRVTQVAIRAGKAHAGKDGAPYMTVVRWDRLSKSYVWDQIPGWVDELVVDGYATREEVKAWKQQVQSPSYQLCA